MARLWQAWPIHRTADVHATSRCRHCDPQLVCNVSASLTTSHDRMAAKRRLAEAVKAQAGGAGRAEREP